MMCASVVSIFTKSTFDDSAGRIRLITTSFSKPATPHSLARNTSAIPPSANRCLSL